MVFMVSDPLRLRLQSTATLHTRPLQLGEEFSTWTYDKELTTLKEKKETLTGEEEGRHLAQEYSNADHESLQQLDVGEGRPGDVFHQDEDERPHHAHVDAAHHHRQL